MIWYEHVGAANEHKYVLKLMLAVNLGGVGITSTPHFIQALHNGGNDTTTYTLNSVMPPASLSHPQEAHYWRIPKPWRCGADSNWVPRIAMVLFESNLIDLDSNQIYQFYFEGHCCRDISDNINSANNLLLRANLDTHFKPFSVQHPNFSIFQTVIPQNVKSKVGTRSSSTDSVQLSWSHVYNGSHGAANPVPYQSGHNLNSLLGAGGITNITMNSSTLSELKAINQGSYNFGLKSATYQFSPASQSWVETGWSVADYTVYVSAQVDSSNYEAFKLDTNFHANATFCGTNVLQLYSPAGINANSLDTSGTQFRFYQPDGSINPIIKAKALDNFTISLELLNPIDTNGIHKIEPRFSFNGQYLSGRCGYALQMEDIFVNVSDCNTIGLEESSANLRIYPNPNRGALSIENYPAKAQLYIYNLGGNLVFQDLAKEQMTLSLNQGFYWIEIRDRSGESLLREKLLVQ